MSLLIRHPLSVSVAPGGAPLTVGARGTELRVVRVCNRWRVESDWWRVPVARDFWRVILNDGSACEVSHDLIEDTWQLERLFD